MGQIISSYNRDDKMLRAAAWLLLPGWMWAQSPPEPPKDPGVFRLPPAMTVEPPKDPDAKPPEEEPAKPALLTYDGKPIALPFACTEDDITAFGMTCTEQDPCPVYAEISALQPVGLQLFLTGNFHNGASTMYSLFLKSEDAGKTWYEPYERIRRAGFDQVQFIDFETGWVSGQILESLPKDPFFLLTRDGGKSWQKRNVFSESRIATIEQFHFESKTQGSLLIDRGQGSDTGARYERYESMTGGDSWMVREVSAKPLALRVPRTATSNADWRLRADAKLGAHFIEKRSGNQWQRVSAFLVKAGECKPESSALPEPPEPPEPAASAPSGPPPPPAVRPRSAPSLKKK
jgi:hypothetical protein